MVDKIYITSNSPIRAKQPKGCDAQLKGLNFVKQSMAARRRRESIKFLYELAFYEELFII